MGLYVCVCGGGEGRGNVGTIFCLLARGSEGVRRNISRVEGGNIGAILPVCT